MIILDTNVVSELMRDPPDPAVLRWLGAQGSELPWTTTLSVFEIRFGLAALPAGARRARLMEAFDLLLTADLKGRIVPLDESGATAAATLGAARKARGRAGAVVDTLIAGIAVSRGAIVATRNVRHFDDLPTGVVDPWAAGGI